MTKKKKRDLPSHPKKTKKYKSKETFRKFRAYIHMRTPSGEQAKHHGHTISARTPTRAKEKTVRIAGKLHRPDISRQKPSRGRR